MPAFPHDGSFVDPACPLDWSHPLNRGLVIDCTSVPNAGWGGGSTVRTLVRGGRNPTDGTPTAVTWAGPAVTTAGRPRAGVRSLKFNGTSSTVSFGSVLSGYPFTVAAWARPTTTGADEPVWSKGSSWFMGPATTDAVGFRDNNAGNRYLSAATLADGGWHFHCLTCSGSGANLALYYFDGQLVATGTLSINTGTLVAGQDAGRVTWMTGYADGLLGYDRALSAGQVAALYDETRRGNPARLRWVSTRSYWSTQAAGGTAFTGSYAGSTTASGALTKAVSKNLAGSVTAAGALAKAVSKPLAGSVTGAGSLAKAAAKPLAGSATPVGALAKQAGKPLAGSSTGTGALAKQAGKTAAGSSTGTGSLVRACGKGLAGSVAAAGSLTKAAAKVLGGSLTAAGVLTKAVAKAMAGSSTIGGALTVLGVKLVTMGGSVTGVGSLVRAVAKYLAGLVTGSGDLATSGGSSSAPAVYVPGTWPRFDVPARTLSLDAPARTLHHDLPRRSLDLDVPIDGVRVP